MNRASNRPSSRRGPNACLLLVASLVIVACGWPPAMADPDDRIYRVDYKVSPAPSAGGAWVEMRVRQPGHFLRAIDMPTLSGRLSDFSGDGEVSRSDERLSWMVPRSGGKLRWFARLDHRRANDGYDAYIEPHWALFRGEDLIPSATTRALKHATSETSLSFDLPDDWSVVTPYRDHDGTFRIDDPQRRHDTPTGWIVAGQLGVRIETIEDVRVIVAGPVGQSIRRMDLLALLRWTVPYLQRILPGFPRRLTIVSAGEPMWLGALSAPQSIYVHAVRPLISGNATSTLVHEAVHVGLGLSGEYGADWIVEGLAEYYSLEVLRRSGTISETRFRSAHRDMAAWARDAENLCEEYSSGSSTALAVTIMAKLDAEIRAATAGRSSLDDVLQRLSDHPGKISVAEFREVATDIAGTPLKSLQDKELPGCKTNG